MAALLPFQKSSILRIECIIASWTEACSASWHSQNYLGGGSVHVMRFLVASVHQDGLGAPLLQACHLLLLICCTVPCSMDKLYDLMVMGLKYQLLCCRQTSELLQVSQELLLVHSLDPSVHAVRLSLWVTPKSMYGASTPRPSSIWLAAESGCTWTACTAPQLHALHQDCMHRTSAACTAPQLHAPPLSCMHRVSAAYTAPGLQQASACQEQDFPPRRGMHVAPTAITPPSPLRSLLHGCPLMPHNTFCTEQVVVLTSAGSAQVPSGRT